MALPKLCFTATRHHHPDGTTTVLNIVGREAWALLELVEAGAAGCTPLNNPAPRWSDYVFRLRHHGFTVETIDENHGGPFAGQHARYVLRDRVSLTGGNLDLWRPKGVRYAASVIGRAA